MLFWRFQLQVYTKERIEMYHLLLPLVVQYEKNVEEYDGVKNSYC